MTKKEIYLVDTHTHVLPGVDDGPAEASEGVEMIKELQRQGANLLVSSSHFYLHKESVDSFLDRRQEAYNKLLKEWEKQEGNRPLPILLGAEVSLERKIGYEPKLGDLKIDKTNIIMLELAYGNLAGWEYGLLENIAYKFNLRPMLAHIDRYLEIFDPSCFKRLKEIPDVIFQFNTSVIRTRKGRNFFMSMVKEGVPILLGTDSHGIARRRPEFQEMITFLQKKLDDRTYDNFILNANKLLDLL